MVSRLEFKRKLARLATAIRHKDNLNSCVLLYHSIGGGPDSTGIGAFREQISLISRIAKIVDLAEALMPEARESVAITFDDGYASVATNAARILSEYGATATVYVNTGWIGRDRSIMSRWELGHYRDEPFLTWDAIVRLLGSGWRIGSHGVDHVDLTRIDKTGMRNQLERSRATIEAATGVACRHFAYTWGRHNARIRAAVSEAGYQFAAAGHHSSLAAKYDLFAIPRINVCNDWTLDDLRAVIRGDWDYLGWIQRGRLWLTN